MYWMICSRSCVSCSTRHLLSYREQPGGAARRNRTGQQKLIRVLTATLNGPRRGFQQPGLSTASTDQSGAESADGRHPDFQPGTGIPQGDQRLFRIKDHRLGLATVVSLPAQRPAAYAGRRWCTGMYETTNEIVAQLSLGWPVEGKHADHRL